VILRDKAEQKKKHFVPLKMTTKVGFYYKEGHDDRLFLDQTSVKQIIERLSSPPTPFVLYSFKQFLQNIDNYQQALNELAPIRARLSYSMKANYNPYLLPILKSAKVMLTTVSGGEMQLALSTGFEPSTIIYNGNGKTDESIRMAIDSGVLLNVDSLFDLEVILQYARELNKIANVLIRVNPVLGDSNVHEYNITASKTSKFGTSIDELEPIYKLIEDHHDKWIRLFGFHCHLGSTISNTQVIVECAEKMIQLFDTKRFPHLRFLNIGGGLNIDYKRYAKRTSNQTEDHLSIPTIEDYIQAIKQPLQSLPNSIELIVEPGRSLIANSSILITRVLGQKQTGVIRQLVVDASMTECIRPALYQAYHHIDTINSLSTDERIPFDIVGPVCESGDFLGKQRCLPKTLKRGDFLAIFDTGAYCSSMSSNYNMRPRPAEYTLDEYEHIKVLRRRETNEDLLRTFCIE
jgi:diaminopimelate decarboxylase